MYIKTKIKKYSTENIGARIEYVKEVKELADMNGRILFYTGDIILLRSAKALSKYSIHSIANCIRMGWLYKFKK